MIKRDIPRPECPHCGAHTMLARRAPFDVESDAEIWTFECPGCEALLMQKAEPARKAYRGGVMPCWKVSPLEDAEGDADLVSLPVRELARRHA